MSNLPQLPQGSSNRSTFLVDLGMGFTELAFGDSARMGF